MSRKRYPRQCAYPPCHKDFLGVRSDHIYCSQYCGIQAWHHREPDDRRRRSREYKHRWIQNGGQPTYKKYPWIQHWYLLRTRCTNPRRKGWKNYGGRGIKALITQAQIKKLWKRDHANQMIRPSIDRIDPDGHYTMNNCRFIEWIENIRRRRSTFGQTPQLNEAERQRRIAWMAQCRERVCSICHTKSRQRILRKHGEGEHAVQLCKTCEDYLSYVATGD